MTTEYITYEKQLLETIQQLWRCLDKGYTYDEAQIHMNAYKLGKTSVKKVVVIDKEEE